MVILQWIGKFLSLINRLTGSYMVSLLVFAFLIELLMLPIGIKQQKNSIKQAKLRPKEMAIRNRYKGREDRATMQKVQMEVQELYQKEGYSQFAGCLPLIIQLIVVLLLYQIVINPLLYVLCVDSGSITTIGTFITASAEDGGLGMALDTNRGTIAYIQVIKDAIAAGGGSFETAFAGLKEFTADGLAEGAGAAAFDAFASVADNLPNFSLFGLNLGYVPTLAPSNANEWWLLTIPVLTFAVYFVSMKLTRKLSYQPVMANDAATGCSNKIMDIMMPLMSVWITFMVPAAVGVYWIYKSILGTLKQFILFKAMPLPTFTEEEYKEAEKEFNKKNPQKKGVEKSEFAGAARSLHHIDDEDFEDTRERAERAKAAAKAKAEAEKVNADADAESNNGSISVAPLKKDDKDRKEEKVNKAEKLNKEESADKEDTADKEENADDFGYFNESDNTDTDTENNNDNNSETK